MRLRPTILTSLTAALLICAAPIGCAYADSPRHASQLQFILDKAREELESESWTAAKQLSDQALQLDPKSAFAHYLRGSALLGLGQPQKSLAEAEWIRRNYPERFTGTRLLMSIHQARGELEQAVLNFLQFLRKYPDNVEARDALPWFNDLRIEMGNQKRILNLPSVGSADYFTTATASGVHKWNEDRFPLNVFIPPVNSQLGANKLQVAYTSALHQAFVQWQFATNNRVRFQFTDSPKDADIVCGWTTNPHELLEPFRFAETRHTFDKGLQITHANILMLMPLGMEKSPGPVGRRVLSRIALHEIGHALGIIDHSPNPADIMYFCSAMQNFPASLTTRDAQTIIHLYRPEVTYQPPSARVRSLIQSASERESDHCFAEAVDRLEFAWRLAPTSTLTRISLSNGLHKLGLQYIIDKKYPQAISTINRAIDLVESIGDCKILVPMWQDLKFLYEKTGAKAETIISDYSLKHLGQIGSREHSLQNLQH
jgi:tetratricopeptide (TPR) repeat protein